MTAAEVCRGCGGTGIDAHAPSRAAQIASLPILMRKSTGIIEGGGTSNVFRGVIDSEVVQRRMFFQGPLMALAAHVDQRLRDGYEIVDGDPPDRALACQWCNGHGSPAGQLTVRALEKLAEN